MIRSAGRSRAPPLKYCRSGRHPARGSRVSPLAPGAPPPRHTPHQQRRALHKGEPQTGSPEEVDAEVTEAVDGVLETAVGDNFFTLNNLKVPLGETTTIEITNEGIAIHNMRIAGPDGEFNTADDTVSDPDLISGGGTASVEFTPTLAGTYTFQCDFHPTEQGGVIVVAQ